MGRRLAAILFADIVGFSRQLQADETAGLEGRRRVEEEVRARAGEHGGRVVKSIGDALMIEFGSAVAAVDCGLAIQQGMAALAADPPVPAPVQLRIGIHLGDVVEEDGDLYGNAVNVAARLQKLAAPGGVCVSRDLYTHVRPVLPVEADPVPREAAASLPEGIEALRLREGAPLPAAAEAAPLVPAAERPAVPAKGGGMTLSRAQQLAAEKESSDGFLSNFGWALGFAVISAILFTLAGWVAGFQYWGLVAALLRMGGYGAAGAALVGVWHAMFGGSDEAKQAGLDDDLLGACLAIGPAPPELAGPLDRALNAYVGIRRLSGESAWDKVEVEVAVPVRRYAKQARKELLSLLEHAQHVARAGDTLNRLEGREETSSHYQEAADLYTRHCARLETAAERLEQAEAALSHGLLLVSGPAPSRPALEQPLQEMRATFDALAETRASFEATPAPGDGERHHGDTETRPYRSTGGGWRGSGGASGDAGCGGCAGPRGPGPRPG